jgi:ribosomal protein L32
MSSSAVKLIACRVCGVIMVKLSRDVCPKCHQVEEQLFIKVRDYVRTHPGLSIDDVAKAVGASEQQIQHFIISGRLERVGAQIAHKCQTCSKVITTGLICPDCSRGLKEQVGALQKEIARQKRDGDDDDSNRRKKDSGPAHKGKPRDK